MGQDDPSMMADFEAVDASRRVGTVNAYFYTQLQAFIHS